MIKMTFQEALDDLNSRQIPLYMLKEAKHGYICVGCGNGSGDDGTGAELKENGTRLMCGKMCGHSNGVYTYLNVAAADYKIDLTDFAAGFKELCQREGIELINNFHENNNPARKLKKSAAPMKAQPKKEMTQELQEVINTDIKAARANWDKLSQENKFGITDLTAEFWQLGAIGNWINPKARLSDNNPEKDTRAQYPSPRVIFPHLTNSALPNIPLTYCAGLFMTERTRLDALKKDDEKNKKYHYKKYLYGGIRTPYGLQTLNPNADKILATEGEKDCISIWQATDGKFPCLATGGTGTDLNLVFDALADFYKNKKPVIYFFADNDDAGKNFVKKITDAARQAGFIAIPIYFAELNAKKLDANKILLEQGNDKLAEILNEKIALAQVELDKIAAEMEKESALKEKITDWTKRNGEIENLDEVKAAAAYLQSFTVDKITSTVAGESKTIQALAKCSFYDFYQQVANDFLTRVSLAKDAAKEKVKNATAENPVADSARMTALIDRKRITDAVKKEITAVEKKHLKYQQAQEQLRLQEEYLQSKQETQIKNQGLLERLKELQQQPPTPARNSEIQEIISELCEWNYNKHGEKISVKSSMANYDLIFTYDPFVKELFGYEEFSQSDVFLKTPLWGKRKNGEKWTDSDDSNLRVYLRRTYTDICGEKLYYDVFNAYSVQNSFNVVHNYFNNLPEWDGKERAETLFIDFLKVSDTPFARAVTFKWLLAAVARIFYPGCNFQAALVLQGNQNIGKSYILEKLGGAWYGALIDNVDDMHAVDAIKNLWIVEMKEFSAARKAEINAVKSFIERAADNHRAAYADHSEIFRRHCVFAISVNDKQFLRDLTGNRRYWILESPLAEFDYIDSLTPEYIQQIWAEVFYKFKELTKDGFNDKILELPKELKIQAENIAEKFTVDDGLQKEIPAFLDIPILPPVLWKLLTKDEKRKFFAKNSIELDAGDWDIRREMLKSDAEKQEFDNAIAETNKNVRHIEKKFGNDSTLSIAVYGSYTRQETCAVEIQNEFNGKRIKTTGRIHDVLSKLENWKLIDKQQNRNFNGYGHQRNIYRRITDAKEVTADDSAALAQDSNYFVEEVDVPF